MSLKPKQQITLLWKYMGPYLPSFHQLLLAEQMNVAENEMELMIGYLIIIVI